MKSKIKTHVITLSSNFMKGHPRSGEPTYFEKKFTNGVLRKGYYGSVGEEIKGGISKIHTIRKTGDWERKIREVQEGEAVLSIRRWIGKPYRSSQMTLAILDKDSGIGTQSINLYKPNPDEIYWQIDGGKTRQQLEEVAENDGLSIEDFRRWFFPNTDISDVSFCGTIIHFTDFRY